MNHLQMFSNSSEADIAGLFRTEQGLWYDHSDMATMFQDIARTIPAALEMPDACILDKSGRGNYSYQTATPARAVLSARQNLLTDTGTISTWPRSTAFGGSAIPIVTPGELAPDGTNTAIRVQLGLNGATSTGVHSRVSQTLIGMLAGTYIRQSFWLKSNNGVTTTLRFRDDNGGTVNTHITVDANWRKFTHGGVTLAGSNAVSAGALWLRGGDGTSDSADVLLWQPLVTIGELEYPYQRVTSATDYDAGPAFPRYLKFDGINDFYTSATGGGGTAGFYFAAAIKANALADTALFDDRSGGSIGYSAQIKSDGRLRFRRGTGSAEIDILSTDSIKAGETCIVSFWDDGVNVGVQINSNPPTTAPRTAVISGGNGFSIGRVHFIAVGFFNGSIYSSIYCKDSAPTQVQREVVAAYQRKKAGMP